MKIIKEFIQTNIYISVAAVLLTVESQIQLGMQARWHPYLFLIFFATLFEYNLHRLITVLTNKEALNREKYRWVSENTRSFYILVFISVTGFIAVSLMATKEVLLTFAPIAALTIFYSIPVKANKNQLFRLREIPYVKLLLIAFVWSASTVLLPIVQSLESFNKTDVLLILLERFLFIAAITIPFDIRDLKTDRSEGLKTLPMLVGEKRAWLLSYLLLLSFFLISYFHYGSINQGWMIWALGISTATTFWVLYSKRIRKHHDYHYGILDGTMILQAILMIVFYYFN
ncbi:MAG TPA: UbiA family prenyltransferase [Prolixibacteraceae bacterium]|nr:UbiA family prenyltransferase [Prolixibacteraceae bacterium]